MLNANMSKAENFIVGRPPKLMERNFESGYDTIDTGVNGSAYGAGGKHSDQGARLDT